MSVFFFGFNNLTALKYDDGYVKILLQYIFTRRVMR